MPPPTAMNVVFNRKLAPSAERYSVSKRNLAPAAETKLIFNREVAPLDGCLSLPSLFHFGTFPPRLSRCRTLPKEQRFPNCFTFQILSSPPLVLALQSSEAEDPDACAHARAGH
jgi:hypothetical protein